MDEMSFARNLVRGLIVLRGRHRKTKRGSADGKSDIDADREAEFVVRDQRPLIGRNGGRRIHAVLDIGLLIKDGLFDRIEVDGLCAGKILPPRHGSCHLPMGRIHVSGNGEISFGENVNRSRDGGRCGLGLLP